MRIIQHDDHVFVNCPFDSDYRAHFHALIFTVHDCGFVARCALEVEDSGQVRIEKIVQIIGECRLGIHDISRTELDQNTGLPRFNMPLELGVFLGANRFGTGSQRRKIALIVDREQYRYQQFCSDISGQDIKSHRGSTRHLIKVVRDWLRTALTDSDRRMPGGAKMAERFELFQRALPLLCDQSGLDEADLIYRDYTTLVSEWLKANPL